MSFPSSIYSPQPTRPFLTQGKHHREHAPCPSHSRRYPPTVLPANWSSGSGSRSSSTARFCLGVLNFPAHEDLNVGSPPPSRKIGVCYSSEPSLQPRSLESETRQDGFVDSTGVVTKVLDGILPHRPVLARAERTQPHPVNRVFPLTLTLQAPVQFGGRRWRRRHLPSDASLHSWCFHNQAVDYRVALPKGF